MSAFIGLVVVGASVAIVTWIVTDEATQPATRSPAGELGRRRAPTRTPAVRSAPPRRSAAALPGRPPSTGYGPAPAPRWWQRLRSAVLLMVIVAALGFAAAAVVGVATVLLVTFLRDALG